MKISFFHSVRKKLAIVLAVVIGMVVINNIVFMHAHILDNGKIIVHAHPYNKSQDPSPFKEHQHSAKEFLHISHIQLLFFVFFLIIALSVFNRPIKKCRSNESPYNRLCYVSIRGRAPPGS